mmetsp:Transcript_10172/g.19596  ORF Transcript_10172/g.19596 Transcript_10172/m.19596 type:complete len:147 (-) Transcript_10172:211-651(-)
MRFHILQFLLALSVYGLSSTQAFTPLSTTARRSKWMRSAQEDESSSKSSGGGGVVELGDNNNNNDDDDGESKDEQGDIPKAVSGPLFISQGEVDPDTLNPDFSNAKQTRVVLYTILSLLPVLFLIPFMLGRDFIPADQLPPVEMMN